MFKQATKMKLRFETDKGKVTTEDLWDLPLTSTKIMSLDDLARSLKKKLREEEEESFVVTRTKHNETLNLKFEIVKDVINTKLEESRLRKEEAERKEKEEMILQILSEKEYEELRNQDPAELRKMVSRKR